MKTSVKTLCISASVILATVFASWTIFGNADSPSGHYNYSNRFLNDDEYAALLADIHDFGETPFSSEAQPIAEDVLVQRIPGDNNHLLMIAVYSKENYSGKTVTIEINDTKLLFRDDGKGDDKKAGDEFFTAKIDADVNEFRKLAMEMAKEMKESGEKPFSFVNRAIITDPDAIEGFDVKKFDGNIAVSISSLQSPAGSSILQALRANSVFITNLAVVEDPLRTWNPCTQTGNVNGAWTFKSVMNALASPDSAHLATDAQLSTFVKNFFNNWAVDQVINSDTVKARTLVNTLIINPWLTKSKNAGSPTGQLDMKYAPFKLTGIINRFDLRERVLGIPLGEGRYTFCLIDSTCTTSLPFNLVFEYHIKGKDNCDTLRAWAQQWYDLKDLTLGTPEYNAALQKITDQYSGIGVKYNKGTNTLNHIRTNDRALSPTPIIAEFREFGFNDTTQQLKEKTTGQVPSDKYNVQIDNPDVRRMVDYINNNRAAINKDQYTVPDIYLDSPFVAGATHILGNTVGNPPDVYHWDGTEIKHTPAYIKNSTTRHVFSLNSCSGCHAGEVQTNFNQVDNVFFGTETTLGGFIGGKAVQPGAIDSDNNPDNDSMMIKDAANRPASNPQIRFFSDITRRARDLKDFISTPCMSPLQIRNQLMFRPVHMVH